MMRTLFLVGGILVGLTAAAAPASAQIVHGVSFGTGMFTPRSVDNRVDGDVWYEDLHQPIVPGTNVTGSLAFNVKDFRSWVPVFGEWHIGFGKHVEVGIGASYYNQTVHSVYADLVNGHGTPDTGDDTEIKQDLRLQMVPITAVVRVLSGRPGHFQAYAGGGLVADIFKYSEAGDFVDTSDFTVFTDRFTASGTAFGPMLLGGIRTPLGGDIYALNFEGRYQWAVGKTGGFDAGFLGDKLDLSGWFLNASFMIRF
jgi:hypothetical protein